MDVTAIGPSANVRGATASATDGLEADDFLKLLVAQLSNQDPLAPTSNEELLSQLSSIRDIQLSTQLVDSLKSIAGIQGFGSAAALIGKQVSGQTQDAAGAPQSVSGLVIGVRFDADGRASLELDNGALLPIEQLQSVESPGAAAESLVGRIVRAVPMDDGGEGGELIEGMVTSVRDDGPSGVVLELDGGDAVRLRDVVAVQEVN